MVFWIRIKSIFRGIDCNEPVGVQTRAFSIYSIHRSTAVCIFPAKTTAESCEMTSVELSCAAGTAKKF